mmetsp:Transcript_42/g.151  ORF Transcript_42/g.151 Transcript_42/m.151 type:complete len:253 (-) Transcript_42:83-841(-)
MPRHAAPARGVREGFPSNSQREAVVREVGVLGEGVARAVGLAQALHLHADTRARVAGVHGDGRVLAVVLARAGRRAVEGAASGVAALAGVADVGAVRGRHGLVLVLGRLLHLPHQLPRLGHDHLRPDRAADAERRLLLLLDVAVAGVEVVALDRRAVEAAVGLLLVGEQVRRGLEAALEVLAVLADDGLRLPGGVHVSLEALLLLPVADEHLGAAGAAAVVVLLVDPRPLRVARVDAVVRTLPGVRHRRRVR